MVSPQVAAESKLKSPLENRRSVIAPRPDGRSLSIVARSGVVGRASNGDSGDVVVIGSTTELERRIPIYVERIRIRSTVANVIERDHFELVLVTRSNERHMFESHPKPCENTIGCRCAWPVTFGALRLIASTRRTYVI
jgi:hypothetical protein